eukprot:311924_1
MTSKQFTKRCQQSLFDQVENADDENDLVSILQSFDLDYLKQCIKNKFHEGGNDTILKSYFYTAPMNDIFNKDIIQNILSFIHSNNEKLVNKTFKKCVENNERNLMKQRNEAIKQMKPFTHPIKYDKNQNTTWIVDHSRAELTDNETQLGYQGPLSSIKEAIWIAEENDKIIIICVENKRDSRYADNDSAIEINKSLQIISISNNIILKDTYTPPIMIKIGSETNCHVYFENVTFDFADSADATEGSIHVSDGSSLWMKNCKMYNRYYGIMVCKNANLYVRNCQFSDGGSTLVLSPIAKNVSIIGCTFTNCASPIVHECITDEFACIDITDEYYDMHGLRNEAEIYIIAKLLK